MVLKNINIQINTMAMLSKINGNITLNSEEENAIIIYDDNLRKDIFYSELTSENKTIWNNYINLCLNKVDILKDYLGQILNQYDDNRIIINTIDILIDSSKQFIINNDELNSTELTIFNSFNEMIKSLL